MTNKCFSKGAFEEHGSESNYTCNADGKPCPCHSRNPVTLNVLMARGEKRTAATTTKS